MKLQLKAKHFDETSYQNHENCAIAKALKEHFNVKEARELIKESYIIKEHRHPWKFWSRKMFVSKIEFKHAPYNSTHFMEDQAIAEQTPNDETIIREIELTKKRVKVL